MIFSNADALPPTDKTELNYRTRPLTLGQEAPANVPDCVRRVPSATRRNGDRSQDLLDVPNLL